MRLWDSPTNNVRVAALIAAAVAVLAFANSLGNDFAYDDRLIILENTAIQSPSTLVGTFFEPYWPNRYGKELGLWRPLTTWVYGLQWLAWDGAPVGFHLVNVLLNAAVTGLVVLLLAELMPLGAAFLGGLIFAVHPVHVEAVANVVGMAEILSALPFLLACLILLRAPPRLTLGGHFAIWGLFGAAFLMKESAVTLPGVVFLLDGARKDVRVRELGTYVRDRWLLYSGMIVVAILGLAGRVHVLGTVADPFAPMGADILAAGDVPRIWTVMATWPEIVRLMFFPADLSADYTPEVISIAHGWNPQTIMGLTCALVALGLALGSWRTGVLSKKALSARAMGFGVVWFIITLSPTSNLVFLSGVLLAERTLYLPSVGFVAGVAWLLCRFYEERPRGAVALALVALCLMTVRTYQRNPTWMNNTTVFDTLVEEHPESARAQWVMGDLHFQKGEFDLGMAAYRRAIGMVGGHYTLLSEIGRRMVAEEFDRVGEYVLRHAWRERPEFGLAPSLLTVMYDRQQRWPEAEEAARAVLAVDPNPVQAHLLSRSLAAQNRVAEAIDARKQVIELGEDRWEQWRWLSELELLRGDTLAAVEHLDSARVRVRGPSDLARVDSLRAVLLPVVALQGS